MCMLAVNGDPLGVWMNENEKAKRDNALPRLVKRSDDGHVVSVKGLIGQMLCAAPGARCSMGQVRDSMRILYGEYHT
jgi:hypothetical protein